MTSLPVLLLALVFALAACSLAPVPSGDLPSPRDPSPWVDAAGATQDPALAQLCRDLWEFLLASDPIEASRQGDRRFYGELRDRSPAGRAAEESRLRALLAQAQAVDAHALSDEERVTLAMARDLLETRLARAALRLDRWRVDPAWGVHQQLLSLAPDQPAADAADRAALLKRWAAMPAYVDQMTAALREGLDLGLVAPRAPVERAVGQLARLLAQPTDAWPLARPARLTGLSPRQERAFHAELARRLHAELRPAFTRLHALLAQEILPRARDDTHAGLAHLPDGDAAYRTLVREHTGLAASPEEIHAIGLQAVDEVRAEIEELGECLFGTDDIAVLAGRLRGDERHAFATRDEVEDVARASLERAQIAVQGAFGRLPRAPCVVVRVAAHEERDTTIAYYRNPAADNSLPGRYFVNTYEPSTRLRFDAEALAFHEAVPGHHLQIALAQELPGLPRFRRASGSTAFVEGWALYAERLADELGLYGGDLDRLGMLSFDAWRACRLVVDTGLHALGWSREQAVAYMLENTLLAPANVANEVDRYLADPGQALAYKLGQQTILRLREQAEQALGERFRLSDFHDVVLGRGAVTLPILEQVVTDWIARGGT